MILLDQLTIRARHAVLAALFVPTIAAAATYPNLGGTWKGVAQRTLCGRPASSVDVELSLTDYGAEPQSLSMAVMHAGPGKVGIVVGSLTTKGTFGSTDIVKTDTSKFEGYFRDNSQTLEKAYGSSGCDSAFGKTEHSSVIVVAGKPPVDLCPATTYQIDLKASDSWGGVGNFQTLSGRLYRASSWCSGSGSGLEQLTLTLKKQ